LRSLGVEPPPISVGSTWRSAGVETADEDAPTFPPHPGFPTTEVPVPERSGSGAGGAQPIPFEGEVVEDANAATLRYRDAIRLADDSALLVMTDFAGLPGLHPTLLARWKDAVRKAGANGKDPADVLRILNQELFDARLHAAGTCVRLSVVER